MNLLSPPEAARRLNISVKTLIAHVRSGDLQYTNVGRGTKKPRRMFSDNDLEDFIEKRTTRESPCQCTDQKVRRFGTTTSKSNVVGFMALRAERVDGRRNSWSAPGAKKRSKN